MLSHDIVAIKQFKDSIELYFNSYDYHSGILLYWPATHQNNTKTVKIDDYKIKLTGLVVGEYIFQAKYDNGEESAPIRINIYGTDNKSKLDEDLLSLMTRFNDNIDLIEDVYSAYVANTNINLTEFYRKLLNKLVSLFNSANQEMNSYDYMNIRLIDNHVLNILFDDYAYFEAEGLVNIYKMKIDKKGKHWKLFSSDKISQKTYSKKLDPDSFYKIEIINDDCLIRSFYHFSSKNEEMDERFSLIMNEKQELEASEYVTIDLFNSSFSFTDEKEQDIILKLYNFYKKSKCVLNRPIVEYTNGQINIVNEDYFNEINNCIDRNLKFVLKEYDHDIEEYLTIYNDKIKSFKVNLSYDTDYYFYVTDNNGTLISKPGYLNIDDNGEELNKLFRNILLDQYIERIYSMIGNSKKEFWGQVRSILDRYRLFDSHDNVWEYLSEQLLIEMNPERNPLDYLIYLINLCNLKHYDNIDREYCKNRLYKFNYNLHVIPVGNHFIKIDRYNIENGTINTEYIRQSEISAIDEIRVNDCDYMIIRCIDKDSFKTSDFVMYNNTGSGSRTYHNGLKVETHVGL